MTATTDSTPPAAPVAPPAAPQQQAKTQAGSVYRLGLDGALAAGLNWLGGVALNSGWGIHVPFLAGWLLLAALFFGLELAGTIVAREWHHQKFLSAQQITMAEKSAEAIVAEFAKTPAYAALLRSKGIVP